jgi:hypothetical protein
MGRTIRIFLNGIANSLNPNGYNNIVSPTREIGESASRINAKRETNNRRINKVTDVRITEITAG